jgi:activating signal cointegrator complex subunit 1
VPFSYAALLSSAAFQAAEVASSATTGNSVRVTGKETPRGRKPVDVDFGEWPVEEIQICKMGSWGPESEYVSVGGITLG